MRKELFTIVIAHYNQFNWLKEAIDSVLCQKYERIQLLIADDCSLTETQVSKIKEQIESQKAANIEEYEVIVNDKNLGTVKNINNALGHAKGNFILFFAADDALYDENVIANFNKSFNTNADAKIITAQTFMYDKKMKNNIGPYVNVKNALKMNRMTSDEQFKKIAFLCLYSSGATAYKKEIFSKYGKFNQSYMLVEDWAYWLYILRMGEKIYYNDFSALKHRDGGVSHSTYSEEDLPSHVRQYYIDILNIYEKELLNHLHKFDYKSKIALINKYKEHLNYYSLYIPSIVNRKIKKIYKYYFMYSDLFEEKITGITKRIMKKVIRMIVKYCVLTILMYVLGVLTAIITLKQLFIILLVLFVMDLSSFINRKFINR